MAPDPGKKGLGLRPCRSGYIGGDISIAEKRRRYMPLIANLPVEHAHWPVQCRCGGLGFVRYHGLAYCPRCGYRWASDGLTALLAKVDNGTTTERQEACRTLGLPLQQCEEVVVQGRYLSAVCGHPLPCPDPTHNGSTNASEVDR